MIYDLKFLIYSFQLSNFIQLLLSSFLSVKEILTCTVKLSWTFFTAEAESRKEFFFTLRLSIFAVGSSNVRFAFITYIRNLQQ